MAGLELTAGLLGFVIRPGEARIRPSPLIINAK